MCKTSESRAQGELALKTNRSENRFIRMRQVIQGLDAVRVEATLFSQFFD